MLNLLEVHITFHIQLGNFALLNLIKIDGYKKFKFRFKLISYLNGGLGQQGSAVELIFLLNALEEDLEDPLRLLITFARQKAHFSELDNDLSR